MCDFDKEPTAAVIAFEGVVLAATVMTLRWLRRGDPRIIRRYLTLAVGVLIFEVFTAPMWHNLHMGVWAYVYHDVSWILTLGWATLIVATLHLVDRRATDWSPGRRFLTAIGALTAVVFLLEMAVVRLGIRDYSPEVHDTAVGVYAAGVPIEALYYVPVFMALVIGFYRYWALVIDDAPLAPVPRPHWGRRLGFTALAVILFELMIEPMVVNRGFPAWSYMYRDITFLMTGMWIVLITAVTYVVDRVLYDVDIRWRFLVYLAAIGVLAAPIEAFLIARGFREYGPTATAEFSGITTWIGGVPVEVALAIPLYMALIVAFARYWELIADNRGFDAGAGAS